MHTMAVTRIRGQAICRAASPTTATTRRISPLIRINPYFGWIDELAIFPCVLTDAQVLSHYNASTNNYRTAVLADKPSGYWDFNMKRAPKQMGSLLVVR